MIAGSHAWVSSKWSGIGPVLALLPGIQASSNPTITALAAVATTVNPLITAVSRLGMTWRRIAAPAGMTISSVSQGMCVISR